MRNSILFLTLLFALVSGGCSTEPRTFVGYTYLVKSYDLEPLWLSADSDGVRLHAQGQNTSFVLRSGDYKGSLGKPLEVIEGEMQPSKDHPKLKVVSGTVTYQAVQGSIVQGNFDLKVGSEEKAPTEVIGSFVAKVQEGEAPGPKGTPEPENTKE